MKHKENILDRILGKFPESLDATAHRRGFTGIRK